MREATGDREKARIRSQSSTQHPATANWHRQADASSRKTRQKARRAGSKLAAWAARQGVWVHRIIRFLDVVELTLLALHLADSELQKLDLVAVCTQRAKISCRETSSQSKTWSGRLQPATHIHDFFSVQTHDRTTPVLRPGRDHEHRFQTGPLACCGREERASRSKSMRQNLRTAPAG